ncbi:MAG: LPXTG cell wall anchor domain-containing protein [Bacillota bacterium]
MTLKVIKTMLVILFAASFIIVSVPTAAFGEAKVGAIIIEGNVCGLVVEATDEKEDVGTGNLNPGDIKYSSLKLTNTGSVPLTLSIRTNVIKQTSAPDRNGKLADVMELTIKDGGNDITGLSGKTFSEVDKKNISIGNMSAGSEKILNFYVNLPGGKTGNDYQGASMKVNWTFTTTCSTPERERPERETFREVPDEQIPAGPPVDEETPPEIPGIEIIIDEEIPAGPIEMPDTGEISPFYFYGAGLLIVMLGVTLRRKRT